MTLDPGFRGDDEGVFNGAKRGALKILYPRLRGDDASAEPR